MEPGGAKMLHLPSFLLLLSLRSFVALYNDFNFVAPELNKA